MEVYTPASYFKNHLFNGEGLFRSAKMLQPYMQGRELNPLVMKAILQGLEEFQEKLALECDEVCKEGPKEDR